MTSIKPVVSVCVVTYNHCNFIKECLDGILMQQTDFPFEVILGEDESDDGTREICKTYAAQYPDKIRLFFRSRKDVIYINGRPTGRFNMIENLKACKGKYIALCEGDDYWTDPLKLQKQINIFEKNDRVILSFHKIKILKADGELVRDFITNVPEDYKCVKTLALKGNYIHTPSVVFKNIIDDFPNEFKHVPFADYFLYLLLAEKGHIHYINDVMAVYRHNVGRMSTMTIRDMISNSIRQYSYMISYFTDPELKELLIKKQVGVVKHYTDLLENKYKRPLVYSHKFEKGVRFLKSNYKRPKFIIKRIFGYH